jgi:hypothetical protein
VRGGSILRCGSDVRIFKVIGVMLLGPLLGILAGFILGVIAMPHQAIEGGRAPGGDGILVIAFILLGLLVSIPLSIGLSWRI